MQTRPNSPDLCQHTCAYPSPQPLMGLTLAPRADAFNDALPPPLPQMRDGGAPAFLHCHICVSSESYICTPSPRHPLPRPSPCVVSLTMCLRPILVPLPLRQFPARCINSPASSLQRPPHAMCPRLHCYTAHLKHEQRASFFRLYILYLY